MQLLSARKDLTKRPNSSMRRLALCGYYRMSSGGVRSERRSFSGPRLRIADWESGCASGRLVQETTDARAQGSLRRCVVQHVDQVTGAILTRRATTKLDHADFSRHRTGDEALAMRFVMQPVEIGLRRLPGAAVHNLRMQFHAGNANLPFALFFRCPTAESSQRSTTNPLIEARARKKICRWQLDSAATNAASGSMR